LTLFAAYRDGKASIVTALYALYPAITVALAVPLFHEPMFLRKGIAIALALAAAVALSCETAVLPTLEAGSTGAGDSAADRATIP
jgi:uncharacterized membrane protein